MSYKHLTLEERKYLQQLLEDGYSIRKIAATLERSPSTISREIKRNKAKYKPHRRTNAYWYNHWRAENLARMRRKNRHPRALHSGTYAWDYIISRLQQYWSPEAISGRWAKQYPNRRPLPFSTIYRYMRREEFPEISRKVHLRRRGKRIMPRKSNYNSIQPDRTIPEWTEPIRKRERLGDWEGDTIFGCENGGSLVSMVDRRSRYLRLGLIMDRRAETTGEAICKMMEGYTVKSISLDNGSEFADFRAIEKRLGTIIYFAEPHKPWQRGTNENINDIVRFFFPKGTNFKKVSSAQVQFVEDLINNRPRKCLGWRTPREVFLNESVALD